MSRGMSESEASAMIVSGFVEPITKELPLEYAVEMNRLIQLQMEGRSARAEALEAYRGLPVPDTTEEHWRFTDLRGFDPDSFTANGAASVARPESMLELDVAGVAYVGEAGIEIERAPEGITFAPLDEAHERLGELVGWKDDKFAAHNAAAWQHGLLVHVPRAWSSIGRCTSASPTRSRADRSSGACS